MFRDTALD